MGLARGVQATIAIPLVHAGTGLLYGVAATVTVSKDGGAFAASTNAASSAADFGCAITLTATEMTADVVTIKVTDATVLTRVVTITTDAALVAANVTQISGDATAADNAEAFFDGTGYAGTNNTIPTVGTVTNPVTAGTVSDKTGYSLAAAYDAAKLAASQASVNAIPTTPLLAANYTAPDNASITAILEDTGTTIPAAIANLPTDADVQAAADAALTAYGAAQTGDIPAADVSAIKAKTDNLPASPAAVGSAMTLTTAYDAAKDAAQPGDAMALTTGERSTLTAAVWAALTAGLTTTGSIGAWLLARVQLVYDKAVLWTTGDVTFTGPVLSTGAVEIVQGDDFANADGRSLAWTDADWPDLTGAHIHVVAGGTTYHGTAESASSVRLELTGTETAAMEAGATSFAIIAYLDTTPVRRVTLLRGTWTVMEA